MAVRSYLQSSGAAASITNGLKERPSSGKAIGLEIFIGMNPSYRKRFRWMQST